MMTLYGMASPNVVKVFIALEDLGLPWELKVVDVFDGKNFEPEFLKLNPNAKVPVLVDPDGPGGKPITIFESGAILIYLAEKTGKLLPKDGAARYEALEWLMVQLTGQGPMSGQLVHYVRFAQAGNDYSKRVTGRRSERLPAMDRRLASSPWLTETTTASSTLPPTRGPAPRRCSAFSATKRRGSAISRTGWNAWRPACSCPANAKQDEVRANTTAFDKADTDKLDRFLQRGRWHIGA